MNFNSINRFISPFFTFIVILLQSCTSNDIDYSKVIQIKVNEPDIANNQKISELLSDIKIVPLETNPQSLISEVNKIVEYDGNYIMQDTYISSSVVAFDSSGKFIRKYGAKGVQAGQYILPMDFYIDQQKNELLILNSETHFINIYDLATGSFKRSKRYNFATHQMIKVDSNCIAFGGAAREKRIFFSDTSLSVSKRFIDYSERYRVGLINPFTKPDDSTILFRMSYDNTIYKVQRNRIIPYVKIDFGDKALSDEFYDSLNEPQKRRLADYTVDKMCNITTYYETADSRVFSFFYKNDIICCVQDKITSHVKLFSGRKNIDDVLHLNSFPTILGTDKDGFFLTVVSAEKISRTIKGISDGNITSVYKDILAPIKITELSNPVLVKFKFQKF